VRADQDRKHATGLVVLDKTHPAHVSRKIVHLCRARAGRVAVALLAQIELEVLNVVETLIPVAEGLDIHGANMSEAAFPQACHEMSSDESAGATYYDKTI
jgi:hypothetical protein